MNSPPNTRDVLIARADEQFAGVRERIASVDEEIARVTEQLSKMERDEARNPSAGPEDDACNPSARPGPQPPRGKNKLLVQDRFMCPHRKRIHFETKSIIPFSSRFELLSFHTAWTHAV
jgi:hypothetical protein